LFETLENIVIDNGLNGLILAVVLTALTLFLYRKTYPEIAATRRFLLVGIRAMIFLLLVLFLINPVLNYTKDRAREPVFPVLVDVSRSMSLKETGGMNRKEKAESILSEVMDAVPEGFKERVEVIPFAGSVLAEMPQDTPGEVTDISGAVNTIAARYRHDNMPAILLISDGVDTRNSSGEVQTGTPVYSVCVGESLSTGQLSIEDILYRSRVYSGMEMEIEAVITSGNLEGGRIEAKLYEDGAAIDSAYAEAEKLRSEKRLSFNYGSKVTGQHVLEIRLHYEGAGVSGRTSEKFRVRVLEDVSRVLYIDRHADWNTTFLRHLAREMKRYSFDFVTRNPEHGYIRISDYSSWDFPERNGELEDYRLVIISDADMIFSDRENAEILEEYLNSGGSVLFLADLNSPLRFSNSYRLIRGFLPLSMVSQPDLLRGNYHIRISQRRDNPIAVAMAETGVINKLPPLPVRLSGFKTTLNAQTPLYLHGENGEPVPFMSFASYGNGISAAVLGLALWKLRLAGEEGRTAYNTIFSSIIQYMAGGRDTGMLEVKSSRNTYSYGETPRINVNVGAGALPEGIKGRLYDGEGELARTFMFSLRYPERGIYSTELSTLSPGYYRVRAAEILKSGRGLSGETGFSVDSVSVEFLRRSADPGFLRRLSGQSGGSLTEREEIRKLIVEKINLQTIYTDETGTMSIRSSGILLILILSLAVMEWVLRKVWGLV